MTQEDGIIWHRNMMPTISVYANVKPGVLGNAKTKEVYKSLQDIRDSLPTGYTIELDGAAEKSVTAVQRLLKPMPIMTLCNHDNSHVPIEAYRPHDNGFTHSPTRPHRCRISTEYYENAVRLYGDSRYHRPIGYDHS